MSVDKWAGLSLAELLAERDALDARIKSVRVNTRDAAIAQVRKLIDAYGLTPAQLLPFPRPPASEPVQPKPARKKVPARYYDPNSGQTWTGRGKPPRWIAGQDFGKYLIPAEGILRQMAQHLPADV